MTRDDDRRGIEDALLVLRAQTGDHRAFERLFTRHEARLLYYLRRIAESPDLADDVFQEAWIRAYRGIGKLEQPRAFRTWLYRIGRNAALDARRRKAREVPLEEAPPGDLVDDSDEDSEAQFREMDVELLHRALGRIASLHREVLTLRFLEGFSYEDIARVVECPLGTVGSRLHHARRALRHEIEELRQGTSEPLDMEASDE
jgi:RNA polymerase sigma-70 factor (ECF subfamily)